MISPPMKVWVGYLQTSTIQRPPFPEGDRVDEAYSHMIQSGARRQGQPVGTRDCPYVFNRRTIVWWEGSKVWACEGESGPVTWMPVGTPKELSLEYKRRIRFVHGSFTVLLHLFETQEEARRWYEPLERAVREQFPYYNGGVSA